MDIKVLKMTDIIPYEKNPRRNEEAVKYVANSIKEFGFRVPLVISKENVIVCGHTRYKAALQLEMTEVPCIIADDLTDEQIKAYRLADNKVAEMSSWDFGLLDEELLNITGIDMEDFGFTPISDIDIDNFFTDAEKGTEKEPKKIQCPHCQEWFEV